MSKRERRDSDRRDYDRRDYDRRDSQPDDEQQRRVGEGDLQESDSLTALKAILSKVAALLRPLQLTSEEAIGLVERLYGSVLDTDMKLAGEADDTRKSSVLAHIQNTDIRREGGRLVVEYPAPEALATPAAPPAETDGAPAAELPTGSEPRRPREASRAPQAPRAASPSAVERARPAAETATDAAAAAADEQPETGEAPAL
jgi:hypothetical protein